jgi:hypothetical protein
MKPFNISMASPSLGAKKRVKKMQQAAEERVSLIDTLGQPTPEPSLRHNKKGGAAKTLRDAWSVTRLMRYLSLTAVSAMVTFFVMGREAKQLHWQEFHHLLEPEVKKDQSQRCYVSRPSIYLIVLLYVVLVLLWGS